MDKRLKNLEITLPNNWEDISEDNPNGPPTFIHNGIDNSGVLQISTAEFLTGKVPNPSLNDLVDLSKNIGIKNDFGDLQNPEIVIMVFMALLNFQIASFLCVPFGIYPMGRILYLPHLSARQLPIKNMLTR